MKTLQHAGLVNFTHALRSRGFACLAGLTLTASTLTLPASAGVTVAITSPTNGATLATPANFQLKATASTSTGAITNVAFFRGSNFLTNDTVAPYSANVAGLQVGNYTFTVRATDSTGLKATNSIIVHVVPDTIRPTVTLQFPVGLQRVTNGLDGSVAIFGTTSDNVGVTDVKVQLNDGPWESAQMNGSHTVWKIEPLPKARTNTYRVYATDVSNNHSLTNRAQFIDVVTSPLTLITNGIGGITRNFTGLTPEVGRTYTLTAVPGPGQVFAGWVQDVSSSKATLNFVMHSNMVIQANFIANPFPAANGVYNGLFSEPTRSQARSGFFTLTLGEHGGFSASARIGTNTYPWSGQFTPYGFAVNNVSIDGHTVLASLSVNLSDNETLTGTLGQADLTAYRAVFSATNPATAYMGNYTLIIPGLNNATIGPGGNGAATVGVGAGGNATINGFTGDGRTLSKLVPLSSAGFAPFYADLYGGRGSMLCWLAFNTNQPDDQITGYLSWIKPSLPGATQYPLGFTNNVTARGSLYVRPQAGTRVIDVIHGQVVFDGGNLAHSFTNNVRLSTNNLVFNFSPNFLSFNINLTNGTFAGIVKVPGTTKTNGFKGALLQDANAGYGWFFGTDETGSVSIQPQ